MYNKYALATLSNDYAHDSNNVVHKYDKQLQLFEEGSIQANLKEALANNKMVV